MNHPLPSRLPRRNPRRFPRRLAALLFLGALGPLRALQISDLVPFGAAAGDTALARGDDNSSSSLSLLNLGPAGSSLDIPFYGSDFTNLYINNNGNVTFNAALSSFSPTGFPNASDIPMIAPYWADVDTRNAASGLVYYRTAQDAATMTSIGQTINNSFLGTESFTPTFAEIVTWDQVGYYNEMADKLNTFQLVIASDGVQTYAMFEYPQGGINWTQGSANPPGSYASVGFDAGDGKNYYNAAGSLSAETLNLPSLTNTIPANPGLQVFRIDNTTISSTPGSPTILPAGNWTGGNGTWVAKGTTWSGGFTTWADGSAAAFGTLPSTVTLGGPITADEMILNTSGYTFTATSAANSLILYVLDLPSSASTVTFGGSLVVLTDQNSFGDTITDGNIVFNGSSVLVARGTDAIAGGALHLQGSAQIQINNAGATTRDATLQFDNTAGGTGGTLDLSGFNTSIGAISSTGAGAGIIKNSGATAAGLIVDFDTITSTFSGLIQNGTSALALTKNGTGTLVLTGANTYTGGTTVTNGALTLNAAGTTVAIGGALTLNGGTLSDTGASTGAETLTGATVNPGGSAVVNTSAGHALALTAITRNAGGVVDFAPKTSSGAGSITTTTTNNSAGILGGYATVNGADWAVSGSTGTNAIHALAAGSYTPLTTAGGGTATTTNFSSTATGTGTSTLSSAITANSLKITDTGSGDVLNNGGNAVTFNGTNGGLLFTGGGSYTLQGAGLVSAGAGNEFIVNVNTASNLTIGSPVVGANAGGLTKAGTGTLVLSGSNSYTGATALDGGVLNLGSASAVSTGNISFGGGTLQYGPANNTDYSAQIVNSSRAVSVDTNGRNVTFASALAATNTGGLILTDSNATPGSLTLSAANAYVGGTTINGASLLITGSGTLGATDARLTLNNGLLDLGGTTQTAGVVNLNGGTLQNGTLNATTYNATAGTVSAALWGGVGATLTKTGTGTLTLSGSNTYSGGTDITAGTLFANNTIVSGNTASATGGGPVHVGLNGTLGGTGSLGGNTTVDGTLAPGTGTLTASQTLTFAENLTLDSTAAVKLQLGAGGLADKIAVTGALVFGGTLQIQLQSGYTPTVGTKVTLVGFGSETGSFSAITISNPAYAGSMNYTTGVLTIVPEPSSAALVLLGCLGLVTPGRRRSRRRAANGE